MTGYGENKWSPIVDLIQRRAIRPSPKSTEIDWPRKVYTTYLYSTFPYHLKAKEWHWSSGAFMFVVKPSALRDLKFKGSSLKAINKDILVRDWKDLPDLEKMIEENYAWSNKGGKHDTYYHTHEVVFQEIPIKYIIGVGCLDKLDVELLEELFKGFGVKIPVFRIITKGKDGYQKQMEVFENLPHKK